MTDTCNGCGEEKYDDCCGAKSAPAKTDNQVIAEAYDTVKLLALIGMDRYNLLELGAQRDALVAELEVLHKDVSDLLDENGDLKRQSDDRLAHWQLLRDKLTQVEAEKDARVETLTKLLDESKKKPSRLTVDLARLVERLMKDYTVTLNQNTRAYGLSLVREFEGLGA